MPSRSTKRFAPEMFDLFNQAYGKNITLRFPEERQARRFAARMNDLRSAMRYENHSMLSIAEGVSVAFKGESDGVYLVQVGPADRELVDIIRQQIDFDMDKGPIQDESREVKSTKGKPSSSSEAIEGFMGRGEKDE